MHHSEAPKVDTSRAQAFVQSDGKSVKLTRNDVEGALELMRTSPRNANLQQLLAKAIIEITEPDDFVDLIASSKHGLTVVINAMRVCDGSLEIQRWAAEVLWFVCCLDANKKSVIIREGAIALLTNALASFPDSPELEYWACRTLIQVTYTTDPILRPKKAIDIILNVLQLHADNKDGRLVYICAAALQWQAKRGKAHQTEILRSRAVSSLIAAISRCPQIEAHMIQQSMLIAFELLGAHAAIQPGSSSSSSGVAPVKLFKTETEFLQACDLFLQFVRSSKDDEKFKAKAEKLQNERNRIEKQHRQELMRLACDKTAMEERHAAELRALKEDFVNKERESKAEFEQQIAELKSEIEYKSKELEAVKKECCELQEDYQSLVSHELKVVEMNADKAKQAQLITELKARIQSLEKEIDRLHDEMDEDHNEFVRVNHKTQAELQQLQQKYTRALAKGFFSAAAHRRKLAAAEAAWQAEKKQLEDQVAQLTAELDQVREEHREEVKILMRDHALILDQELKSLQKDRQSQESAYKERLQHLQEALSKQEQRYKDQLAAVLKEQETVRNAEIARLQEEKENMETSFRKQIARLFAKNVVENATAKGIIQNLQENMAAQQEGFELEMQARAFMYRNREMRQRRQQFRSRLQLQSKYTRCIRMLHARNKASQEVIQDLAECLSLQREAWKSFVRKRDHWNKLKLLESIKRSNVVKARMHDKYKECIKRLLRQNKMLLDQVETLKQQKDGQEPWIRTEDAEERDQLQRLVKSLQQQCASLRFALRREISRQMANGKSSSTDSIAEELDSQDEDDWLCAEQKEAIVEEDEESEEDIIVVVG